MTTTTPSRFLVLSGADTYQGLVSWFEQNNDARLPAKAVMALAKALKEMDDVTGDTHSVDDQMNAARMVLVEMAGWIVDQANGGLPAAVEFITYHPVDVLLKSIELNN